MSTPQAAEKVQTLDCATVNETHSFLFLIMKLSRLSTMEPQQKTWRTVLCLFLLYTCLKLTVVTGLKKVHRAPKGYNVIDSYYVHINHQARWSSVEELISTLETMNNDPGKPEFKAQVHSTFTQAGYGFSATLSNASLQMVLRHRAVEFVEEDQYVQGGEAKLTRSWGLDRIDQVSSNSYDSMFKSPCNLTGNGVDVYVLDTGISQHADLRGRVYTLNCGADQQQHNNNCYGHGTHVAGTIGGTKVGVAPGVNIFSVRVLNCALRSTWNIVLQGIECVLNHTKQRSNRPAVVNMAIVGTKHRAVKRGVESLIKRGITVVGIAGNNNESKPKDACKFSPASIQGVIAVSASTKTDQAYSYSNAGLCVDLYAPGKSIISASNQCDFCFDSKSGSSTAVPHVSGAIALLLERCPNLPPWKVLYHLLSRMTLPDKLDMKPIPRRLRASTPNLLLHVSNAVCTLDC